MSECYILGVPPNGPVEYVKTYRNSWGGAARIWNSLCIKLFNNESAWLSCLPNDNQLWKSFSSDKLDQCEKICLGITFDNVMVKRENLMRVADALLKFNSIHSSEERVDHLLSWADDMRTLAKDDTYIAVCFHHTSVSTDIWVVFEDADNERQYDISKDKGHWFLFDDDNLE